MLKIKNLKVKVDEKIVLDDVNLDFELGKNYALLGKNWSGKSSLALTIMGHPSYEISAGDILLDGIPLNDLPADQRSKKWVFLAFQNIPEVPGLKLFDFLKSIYNAHLPEWTKPTTFLAFKKIINPLLEELEIDRDFLFRDLNVGFSWGEKRKIEILQMKLINPKYVILDEVDSGLDINALKSLWQTLQTLDLPHTSFIIISHYFDILDYIRLDNVYILESGKVLDFGDASLLSKVKKEWF